MTQLTNCSTVTQFCQTAAEIAAQNPTSDTMSRIHKAARSNKRIDRKKTMKLVDKTRKGVSMLRGRNHHDLLGRYVRTALVEGQTCPAKFLAAHGRA